MMTPEDMQRAFVATAKARLDDPMLTEGERTVSTLDVPEPEPVSDVELLDDMPETFEDDVLSRLENLENAIEFITESMRTIVGHVEMITVEIGPVVEKITKSRWFRLVIGGS